MAPKLQYRESTMRDDVVADSGEQDKISRFTVLGYVVESLTRMKSAFSGIVETALYNVKSEFTSKLQYIGHSK